MKPRKVKDITQVLQKKGFALNPEKDHHSYYVLEVDGKRTAIKTYFSHGTSEYGSSLMGQIKKQLKFTDSKKAEDFFDCPLTKEKYVEMLVESGYIKQSPPEPDKKNK